MSDNIPFEVQEEIIKRLPVKSLIQFRSVSKAWKSLIDSPEFIARYSSQQMQPQHLVITYHDPTDDKKRHVLIADDDTFPQQKAFLPIPSLLNLFVYYSIVGSSHGLFCLYGYCGGHNSRATMVVLWNPSIRKVVAVILPTLGNMLFSTVVGFGVCPKTIDPKIVKISSVNTIEVFSLSTGAWRNPYSNLPPRKSIQFTRRAVEVDGFIYFLATDGITLDGGYKYYNLIVSFDLTSEEFREINLPDSLALASPTEHSLYISKRKNSLVVYQHDVDPNNPVIVVWMMEHGVPKSFTKLFSVNVNRRDASIRGFRKSGAPVVDIVDDDIAQLVVYEPYSKQIDNFCVHKHGEVLLFGMDPYVDTLLLLDHPDRMVYNDILKWRTKIRTL